MQDKSFYKNLEDWQKDMEHFQEHPDDDQFLCAMVDRIHNSDQKLKEEITNNLSDGMFDKDPYRYMLVLSKIYEDRYPVVKSKDDIWFEA